jgi:hypothetical protein
VWSYGSDIDWRAQTHGFEDMAAWRNLFPLLGVNAVIGRRFTESEDRPDGNAVMLTWNLFERRFGGNPSIVGRQIHLDGKPYTLIGVLPKWFTYPNAGTVGGDSAGLDCGGMTGVVLLPSATKWRVTTWRDLPTARSVHADGVVPRPQAMERRTVCPRERPHRVLGDPKTRCPISEQPF